MRRQTFNSVSASPPAPKPTLACCTNRAASACPTSASNAAQRLDAFRSTEGDHKARRACVQLIALCCKLRIAGSTVRIGGRVPKRRRSRRNPSLDERKRRASALIELGDLLRNRREGDIGWSQQQVAEQVGCTQGYYAEIEAGTRSSGDVRFWVKVGDALDLAPKRILRLVWEARGSLPVALPHVRDSRRDALLDVAIEQSLGAQAE